MKHPLIAFSLLCLSFGLNGLPAEAQIVGPNGGSLRGNRVVRPNASGGTTRRGWGTFDGPNGGTSTGGYRIRTDDQGNVVYGRKRTSTAPNGETWSMQSSGRGTYDSETGYSGQGTRIINGQTYSTSTENGVITITDPAGNNKTFERRR